MTRSHQELRDARCSIYRMALRPDVGEASERAYAKPCQLLKQRGWSTIWDVTYCWDVIGEDGGAYGKERDKVTVRTDRP